MKTNSIMIVGLAVAGLLTGCATIPPGAERGPHNTMAYDVLIEASEPGARIEVNGESIGPTPLHLKIFGDPDGTFHDFGSPYYAIRALPVTTNQFAQTRAFGTGQAFGPEDRIPKSIYFDMNQQATAYAPMGSPVYVHPEYYGPPPIYYAPPVYRYGPPAHYGPSFRFHIGPPLHHRRRW